MKKLLICLSIILFTLSGCNFGNSQRDKNIISVSILPEKYFIDRLTGEAIEVNVMVPPGASHATYSPTPMQFQKLSDSRLYISIGHLGYEQAWIGRLKELNPDMKNLNLSEKTSLIRGDEIQHGDHVHEGGIDPHIWLSPKVMLELLPSIKDAIIASFPDLKETVEENYPVLFGEINATHIEMQNVSSSLTSKKFMIFHPALTYLARDYGLVQISIEHEGKEPSPLKLAATIDEALSNRIGVIFIQEEYDVRNAKLISKETGAEMVQINPMAYDWIKSIDEIMTSFQTYLK